MTCKSLLLTFCALAFVQFASGQETFPDGSPVSEWFHDYSVRDLRSMGKLYDITDYGVVDDSTLLQTEAIQRVIDLASADGGGVIFIPEGVFLSGSLFFKPGTHLLINGRLKGSDDVNDFSLIQTRIESRNILYFAALVNAIGCDGFTIGGTGSIDGNGLRYWRQFWLRMKWKPTGTNLDEQRPRLVHVADSKDVEISGICLKNSPFWTTHLYRCTRAKLMNLRICAPHSPVGAPSSDAIDLDFCTDVLVKNCYISVNDDAISLKGGRGPEGDKDTLNNGMTSNVIIEDCTYGFCHSALTCGSDAIHCRNIILRRATVDNANNLLWLKMRPDTPQLYEYIRVENIKGSAKNMLLAHKWTQFANLEGATEIPHSYAQNITMRDIDMDCNYAFRLDKADGQFTLSDFTFENINVREKSQSPVLEQRITGVSCKNVNVESKNSGK